MNGRMSRRVVQLSFGFLLVGASALPVLAAESASPSDINMSDLAILEHRYFSHAYGHDPAEKRLERIECLVFGSTREGSNAERMSRLMKAVAARSQQPVAAEKPAHPPVASAEATPAAPSSGAKSAASSKQYPVLNTLEWRAFKKTYPAESLDQRLDSLESKLFGQPAQTMAYIDRVDRLQKTLGIGINTEMNDGITATGPMPKARPRGEENDIDGFRSMTQMPFGALPASPFRSLPPSATMPIDPLSPFGGINPFFGNDNQMGALNSLNQMMQAAQRQMSAMQRLGPGVWVLDPKTGEFVEQNTGKRVPGDGKTGAITPGVVPPSHEGQIREIPGYADPNSI